MKLRGRPRQARPAASHGFQHKRPGNRIRSVSATLSRKKQMRGPVTEKARSKMPSVVLSVLLQVMGCFGKHMHMTSASHFARHSNTVQILVSEGMRGFRFPDDPNLNSYEPRDGGERSWQRHVNQSVESTWYALSVWIIKVTRKRMSIVKSKPRVHECFGRRHVHSPTRNSHCKRQPWAPPKRD